MGVTTVYNDIRTIWIDLLEPLSGWMHPVHDSEPVVMAHPISSVHVGLLKTKILDVIQDEDFALLIKFR
jgi:hypothetical protein